MAELTQPTASGTIESGAGPRSSSTGGEWAAGADRPRAVSIAGAPVSEPSPVSAIAGTLELGGLGPPGAIRVRAVTYARARGTGSEREVEVPEPVVAMLVHGALTRQIMQPTSAAQ